MMNGKLIILSTNSCRLTTKRKFHVGKLFSVKAIFVTLPAVVISSQVLYKGTLEYPAYKEKLVKETPLLEARSLDKPLGEVMSTNNALIDNGEFGIAADFLKSFTFTAIESFGLNKFQFDVLSHSYSLNSYLLNGEVPTALKNLLKMVYHLSGIPPFMSGLALGLQVLFFFFFILINYLLFRTFLRRVERRLTQQKDKEDPISGDVIEIGGKLYRVVQKGPKLKKQTKTPLDSSLSTFSFLALSLVGGFSLIKLGIDFTGYLHGGPVLVIVPEAMHWYHKVYFTLYDLPYFSFIKGWLQVGHDFF